MTALLLHPLALVVTGGFATAEQTSDAYIASQLAVIAGTRLGERVMCPPFGVADATFTDYAAVDVQTCLDRYGPDGVQVVAVTVTDEVGINTGEFVDEVTIEWTRVEEDVE